MSLTIDEKTNTKKKEMSPVIQSVIQMGILLVLSFIGMFIMIFILFIFIRMMPGNPFMFGIGIPANEEMIEFWGLDKPIISQFFIFLWNLISGNWGESLILNMGTPVKEIIITPYSRFLEINLLSFGFSLLLGLIFGICAYKFKDKWYGLIPQAIKRLNWAIFIVGLGMLLQLIFGVELNLLPTTNYYSPFMNEVPTITHFRLLDCLLNGDFVAFWDTITHLIMPVFCLSFIMVSFITELTYSIIDFYKTPKEMHFLSGKIGFYLGLIFTSNILIEMTFCILGMAMLTLDSMCCVDFFLMSAALYRILLTFFIINFSINILLHIIRIVIELVKKSKKEIITVKSTISSETLVSESGSNSPETVSETIVEENSLVLDKNDENKKSIGKEIFSNLKCKIFNPLTILGILFILLILFFAIFAKWIAPYDYELVSGMDYSVEWFAPPSSEHIFGVTRFGRDVFSRCVYGIQTAVKVGFLSTLIGMPLGFLMGIISAFFGKWVKYVIDTINGMILFIPGILFAVSIISISGNELSSFYWILGLINLPIATFFTQQAVSYEMKKGDIKPLEFSKINGKKILIRLPNIILSILGVGCLIVGFVILIFETINWLGWGDISTISLGTDINLARSMIVSAPWAALWPAFWIYFTVLSFIMLGIGLKEE